MNTVRSFLTVLNTTSGHNRQIFYKPGTIPTPVSTDRVAATIQYMNLAINLPNQPIEGEWSGRSVLLEMKASGIWSEVARIDLRPSATIYTMDLITLLFGTRNAVIGPDCELAIKVMDTTTGFMAANELLTVYGAATEQIEYNQDTLIQQLI